MLTGNEFYWDHNAARPLLPGARAAMEEFLRAPSANPASSHPAGRRAARWLRQARQQVAELLGYADSCVLFTSGGSEANHLALFGLLGVAPARHLVVSSIEHPSTLGAAGLLEELGHRVTRVRCDLSGRVSVADVLAAVREDTGCVALLSASNETGVLQPVRELGEALRERGVPLHVDAVQSAPHGLVDPALGRLAATVALSSSKLGGPPGAGALLVREGVRLRPLLRGGAQERGLRPGTPNLVGIVGFGAAARQLHGRLPASSAARDAFEQRLRAALPGIQVNGSAERLPNTSNLAFPGVEGAALLAELGRRGVCAAAGCACHAGSPEPSPVLRAMGLPLARVRGSLRFSFAADTSAEEVQEGADRVLAAVAVLAAGPPIR